MTKAFGRIQNDDIARAEPFRHFQKVFQFIPGADHVLHRAPILYDINVFAVILVLPNRLIRNKQRLILVIRINFYVRRVAGLQPFVGICDAEQDLHARLSDSAPVWRRA